MGARESKQQPPRLEDMEFNHIDMLRIVLRQLSEFRMLLEDNNYKRTNEPINIAVTGESGVGKSSFINSFRGLKAGQHGAAAVGVDETTEEPTQYLHPKNKNIVLWDLPGVGTPKFPKAKYLQMVNFKKYDYFLILTATRFRENDLWLANESRDLGKKFFFVRTKMDIDVRNDKFDHPSISKTETVNKIRKSIATHAETGGLKGVEIFLIDTRSLTEYDFPILQEAISNRMSLK